MTEIMTSYEKSIRRGELMVTRYQVEHHTFDRVADLIADILAYCENNNIDFSEEVKVAFRYLEEEKAEESRWQDE